MKTINEILKDNRYNIACTFIVNCMGETEIFTRETKSKMLRIWGLEEASVRFLNTKEVEIIVM